MTDLNLGPTEHESHQCYWRTKHEAMDWKPRMEKLAQEVSQLRAELAAATEREQRIRALVGDLSRALAESLHGPWDKAQERYADGTRSRDALPDWWSVMLGREDVDG